MHSWGEKTYDQVFYSRYKWDMGYYVDNSGVFAEPNPVWWEALMRFIRRIWRAYVSSPAAFEAVVRRQLNRLADDILQATDDDFETWYFQVTHFAYRGEPISESEFYRSLNKTIKAIQKLDRQHKGTYFTEQAFVTLKQNLIKRKQTCFKKEGSIEDFISDPKSHFDNTKEVAGISVTQQFMIDFPRCNIYIDNVLYKGNRSREKSVKDFIDYLLNAGYNTEEVEQLLRFCSQTSQQSSLLVNDIYPPNTFHPVKKHECEYHISTQEIDQFTALYGKTVIDTKNDNKAHRFIAATRFEFIDSFDKGSISCTLSELPVF